MFRQSWFRLSVYRRTGYPNLLDSLREHDFSSGMTFQKPLEELTVELGNQLEVGMQVMEDALCDWQKSPNRADHF